VVSPSALSKNKKFLVVTGDEFLRRSHIESTLRELLPGDLRSTNLFRFYPDDFNWPSVLSQASTPSLLGGIQVVWISEVNQLGKSDWSEFDSWLKRAPHGSFFIFEADTLPHTHALMKLVRSSGALVQFGDRVLESGIALLEAKVRQAGKQLTSGAWQMLADRLGGSAQLMDLCIDQLILYSDSKTVDETAVNELATRWLRFDPFDLTESLIQKDIPRALKVFHFFYDLSGDVTSTIGLIHWQLRRLRQARKLSSAGVQPSVIGRNLKIPPFRLRSFLEQANRFELTEIERLLEELWRIDWKVKRGACDGAIAMEMFLAGVR